MLRAIVWIVEALIVLFVVRLVLRLLTGSRPVPRSPAGARRQEVAGGTLVRDPQCGTYVPESRAVRVEAGSQTLYFCSSACRDAYQQEHVARTTRVG